MKANGISVLVSKKLGQEFCSWSISYGVTADLEKGEKFEEELVNMETRLKKLLSEQLPVPEAVQKKLALVNGKK